MRRWAFAIAILGMFVMALLLNKKPLEVNNLKDIENLEVNTRVAVSGKVLSERALYGETKMLSLGNKIPLICECAEKYVNETVSVNGIVEEYEGKKQVRVLKIGVV